jgi:predicted  nucleic acid-binding Zn-ribbon protein
VRPPILDAEAKKTSSAAEGSTSSTSKSDAKPSSTSSGTAKPTDKKPNNAPKAQPTSSNDEGGGTGTFIAAILLSAALGMAGTAGLAYFKVFPFNQWAVQSNLTPEIAKLQKRIFDLENAQPDLAPYATNDDLSALQSNIAAIDTTPIESAIASIEAQLATLNTPAEAPAAVDLNPIETALATLEQDVADLKTTQQQLANNAASQASDTGEPTSAAPAIDLTPINSQLAAQSENLAGLQARLETQSEAVANLQADLAKLQSQIATLEQDQSARQAANSAIAAARVPILLSEIDAAIQKGQPFAARLEELSNSLKVTPEGEVMNIAQNGITPASSLPAQFEDLRPTLLAARPGVEQDAPWQDKLMGTLKDAVNLRPLDADGSDPLAILDQIEDALAAQRLADAQQLVTQLPASMQEAATPLSNALLDHLTIEQWQTDMRTTLLSQNHQAEGDGQ